jgi:hypothetical protein
LRLPTAWAAVGLCQFQAWTKTVIAQGGHYDDTLVREIQYIALARE